MKENEKTIINWKCYHKKKKKYDKNLLLFKSSYFTDKQVYLDSEEENTLVVTYLSKVKKK